MAPSLSRHVGRLIKTTGDGALAEFASPLAAMRCAVEIQDHLTSGGSTLRLRLGLNLGDVTVGQNGDLYGDGITIAVRLEGIADPGGILISEKMYREVEGKLDVGFEDRGELQLKNISEPVRAYAVRVGAHGAPIDKLGAALSLPDKPSIAVLPFQNLSGDPEQEFFADGMVEEIITALSRFKALFVIARNSSFTYKGRAVEVKRVGRELGVRYVLEGSVRRAANRVRITGQLIDAATGAHLWADRFDGGLGDIFDLQDQVTERVVGAIAPAVETVIGSDPVPVPKILLPLPSGTVAAPEPILTGAVVPFAANEPRTTPSPATVPVSVEVKKLPVCTTSAEVWAAPVPLIARLACRERVPMALGFVVELNAPNGDCAGATT